MNCGCESGNRYDFDFGCLSCAARHYVHVLGGPDTPNNLAYQKARRSQLQKLYGPEKFAEFRKLVEAERAKHE